MIKIQEWFRKWYYIPLLFLFASLAYLPHITEFRYFRDDWYLMFSANAMGANIFHEIFGIDRPIRGVLFSLLYPIFGLNSLYYNILGYFCRVLGALAFFWTLRLIWPKQGSATFLAAVLYVIFPGFLSAPNAIDFQPHQVGLFFANFSIALSIAAVLDVRPNQRVFIWLSTGLMTFAYLGLVEHFIGLEVFRIVSIFLVVKHTFSKGFFERLKYTFVQWIPFSAGTVLFATWRFIIFETERKATDLAVQLSRFFTEPVLVGVGWMKILVKDIIEVVVLSWTQSFASLWETPLRIRELLFSGILVILAFVVVAFFFWMQRNEVSATKNDQDMWLSEGFWLGLACVIAGFVPVILSNRDADLSALSRYMLASSPGAAIIVAVFISQFNSRKFRYLFICFLLGTSIMTHYLNGVQWARSSEGMRDFWWQVSWRIPQIEKQTTLVVNYSHTSIEEDYFIWGPANFVYSPHSLDKEHIRPSLWGLVLNRDSVTSILTAAEPELIKRRSIITHMDYRNILILTQPTLFSCVQVIDGKFPVVSEYEQFDIQSVAPASNQNHIVIEEQILKPPVVIFGSEPEHDWCYFYESASLAYQRGDFQTVLDLGAEAESLGFAAKDQVEWMPFLQASVLLQDRESIYKFARYIKKNPFLISQACNTLLKFPFDNYETKSLVENFICGTDG